ncbi:MAG: hypothetical protein K2G55_02935 [Lachnospiraceae bacterium]|nr:hypothetical protein [Lachnospiraceae bacterium]
MVALWIAETAINRIDEKEEYHRFCRETIDLCWEWFVNRKVDRWDIYDRVTYEEVNLLDIVINSYKRDSDLSDKYDMILVGVTYAAWQAFNYDEEAYGYPEDLNEMSDEEFERVVNIWIDQKAIDHSRYESLLCYLKPESVKFNPIKCKESKLAVKEKVIEMIQNQSV